MKKTIVHSRVQIDVKYVITALSPNEYFLFVRYFSSQCVYPGKKYTFTKILIFNNQLASSVIRV